MKKSCWTLLCALAIGVFVAPPAQAIPQFQKEFLARYVDGNGNAALADAVKEAKCNVCHEGKKKTDRNVYGEELSKLLDKKEDKENVAKIQSALDSVAGVKSNPADAASPTFGDLLKQGKLPCEPK